MWRNIFKDHPIDSPYTYECIEPGKGIIGSEMHEIYGWGHKYQIPISQKKGIISFFLGKKKPKKKIKKVHSV